MLRAIVIAGNCALDVVASEIGTPTPTAGDFAAPGSFGVLLGAFAILVAVVIANSTCKAIYGSTLVSRIAGTDTLAIIFPNGAITFVDRTRREMRCFPTELREDFNLWGGKAETTVLDYTITLMWASNPAGLDSRKREW